MLSAQSVCSCLRKLRDQRKWKQFPADMDKACGSAEKNLHVIPEAQSKTCGLNAERMDHAWACFIWIYQTRALQVSHSSLRGNWLGNQLYSHILCGELAKYFIYLDTFWSCNPNFFLRFVVTLLSFFRSFLFKLSSSSKTFFFKQKLKKKDHVLSVFQGFPVHILCGTKAHKLSPFILTHNHY